MKINETTLNCCKPKRFIPFTGENSESPRKNIRCKHYEQMSDEALALRSVLKAHNEVSKSGKARLYKALPTVTTALIGTTLAITQPGRLARKAAAGLGFLALTDGIKLISKNKLNKKENIDSNENPIKETIKDLAIIGAGFGIAALAVTGLKSTKAGKFIQKEANKLAAEINKTKLGKFVEETINPFAQKHTSKFRAARILTPLGIIAGTTVSEINLANSLSKDIKEKAESNFLKGKAIQAYARDHFEKSEAQEA